MPKIPTPEYIQLGDLPIPDASRGMGIRVVAGKGSGKSRLIGRTVLFQDFVRGVPTLVIDPTQSLINNFLDKILRLPRKVQEVAYKRIRYINLAGEIDRNGTMRVVPFPLLYKARNPYDAAQRFPDVLALIDPDLRKAPLLGINALRGFATDVGMVLYTMGWQFSEAYELLNHADRHRDRIMEAVRKTPSIAAAARYLLDDYPKLSNRDKDMKTSSFDSHTRRFSRDEISRAVFCADEPGFSWDEMLEKRLTILVDVSKVEDSHRNFAMQWLYKTFIDWVRIESGLERTQPISLVIDELTAMLGSPADMTDPMAEQLRLLTDVYARNHKLWVTVMHQEENQLSPQVRMRLSGIGNQIIGVTSDPDAALRFARRYNPFDPEWERRREKVWGSEQIRDVWGDVTGTDHFVLDERTVDYTIQEQQELNSRRFLEIRAFNFKVGISYREGEIPNYLINLDTEQIDKGEFTQTAAVGHVRQALMQRDGLPVDAVLATIDGRIPHDDDGHDDEPPPANARWQRRDDR